MRNISRIPKQKILKSQSKKERVPRNYREKDYGKVSRNIYKFKILPAFYRGYYPKEWAENIDEYGVSIVIN